MGGREYKGGREDGRMASRPGFLYPAAGRRDDLYRVDEKLENLFYKNKQIIYVDGDNQEH